MRLTFSRSLLAFSYVWLGGVLLLSILNLIGLAVSAPDVPSAYERVTSLLSPFNVGYYIVTVALLLPGIAARLLSAKVRPLGSDARLPRRYLVAPLLLSLFAIVGIAISANRADVAFVLAGEDRAAVEQEARTLVQRVNEGAMAAERGLQLSRIECCARAVYLESWRTRLAEWADRKQYRLSTLHDIVFPQRIERTDDGHYLLRAVETWSSLTYRDGKQVAASNRRDVPQTYVLRRVAGRLWIVDHYFDPR